MTKHTGYKCPTCGDAFNIFVSIGLEAHLCAEGVDDYGLPVYGSESPATCGICRYKGRLASFDPAVQAAVSPDMRRQATFTWWTDDVQEVRPDLNHAQCFRVLERVRRCHNAEVGVNWEVLEAAAQVLFPTE